MLLAVVATWVGEETGPDGAGEEAGTDWAEVAGAEGDEAGADGDEAGADGETAGLDGGVAGADGEDAGTLGTTGVVEFTIGKDGAGAVPDGLGNVTGTEFPGVVAGWLGDSAGLEDCDWTGGEEDEGGDCWPGTQLKAMLWIPMLQLSCGEFWGS